MTLPFINTWPLEGCCRGTNWPNSVAFTSPYCRKEQEGPRRGMMANRWSSQNTSFMDQVRHLTWQFVRPPNNYNSSINDHWSQSTITHTEIVGKSEILWDHQNVTETSAEQMLLAIRHRQTCSTQSRYKPSICKNKQRKHSICEVN